MVKIIHVWGVSTSGKTTSIRLFLENRRIFFPSSPKDILVILPIHKDGKDYLVGVGSAGDTAAIIKKNFTFFSSQKCDIIICASKLKGASLKAVKNEIHKLNAKVATIKTKKFTNKAQRRADNKRVAQEIWQNIAP